MASKSSPASHADAIRIIRNLSVRVVGSCWATALVVIDESSNG